MSDDNEKPQIVVPASPYADQAAAARTLVVVAGAFTAVAGFVSTHNLSGFVDYVQSQQGIAALGIVISGAAFAWGQWQTRHRVAQLTNIASDPRVPDAVAVVASSPVTSKDNANG